jgi:hypothetical protein
VLTAHPLLTGPSNELFADREAHIVRKSSSWLTARYLALGPLYLCGKAAFEVKGEMRVIVAQKCDVGTSGRLDARRFAEALQSQRILRVNEAASSSSFPTTRLRHSRTSYPARPSRRTDAEHAPFFISLEAFDERILAKPTL